MQGETIWNPLNYDLSRLKKVTKRYSLTLPDAELNRLMMDYMRNSPEIIVAWRMGALYEDFEDNTLRIIFYINNDHDNALN